MPQKIMQTKELHLLNALIFHYIRGNVPGKIIICIEFVVCRQCLHKHHCGLDDMADEW